MPRYQNMCSVGKQAATSSRYTPSGKRCGKLTCVPTWLSVLNTWLMVQQPLLFLASIKLRTHESRPGDSWLRSPQWPKSLHFRSQYFSPFATDSLGAWLCVQRKSEVLQLPSEPAETEKKNISMKTRWKCEFNWRANWADRCVSFSY
jgi:hypothetical protein